MCEQNKHYQQLTQGQRYQIAALKETGLSLRKIASVVGVHFTTISRELRRNARSDDYEPLTAQHLSECRRRAAFKANKRCAQSNEIIENHLRLGWSPEKLSLRLPLESAVAVQMSPTTIYKRIEENRRLGGSWFKYLPRYGKSRRKGGKRNKKAGVKLIPNRVDIAQRPAVVETRRRIGDWEGDMVHGQEAYLVTLVERKSRFTLAKRVFSKTKEEVNEMMIAMLSPIRSALTLTLDNGGEFADHEKLTKETGTKVYFAKPHASWQRGTNENTNGLIRRFWPKKFNMAQLTDEEIDEQILLLNMTPRKVLGGLTPFEAFTGQRVALIT